MNGDDIYQDFDRDSAEHRHNRDKIRKAIEKAANDTGFGGVVTGWIVVAEVCDSEDEQPSRTLFIDHAYHDGYGMVTWTVRGLLNEACEELGV
jgi:hypothetical protein